jgi:drug/metabolite transporter (DMT)-like permease
VRVVAGLQFAPGDLWIFLSVPAWALYSVIVKRAPADPPPLALLFATVLFGLAILAPGYALEVATRGGFAVSWPTLASLVYVGAFASVVAFACWNRGVARVGAARAGLFIHLMPVFAAILAMFFLGETMHWYHVAGIAGIAGGIWLSSTGRG